MTAPWWRDRARPPPTTKRMTCRWGCGAQVQRFTDDVGLVRYLDVEPPPITWDLTHPSLRRRVWEWRDGVGWYLTFPGIWNRTWRPIVLEHQCPGMPKGRRKGTP